jgi:hypothetical protein
MKKFIIKITRNQDSCTELFQIKVDMPDILYIDEEAKYVRVEPMVSIGQLNDFLIKRGW